MTNPFRQPEALWKVSFPFRFHDLEKFENYFEELTESSSSHELSSKTVESMPDDLWCFESYFETKPDAASLLQDLKNLDWDPADFDTDLKVEKMEDTDWVAKMHGDFEPISVGKFFITNPAHEDSCPSGMKKIVIESSRAFGTGEHNTTRGCLEAMQELSIHPEIIYDIGTGTGILAIAAAKIWHSALIIGTDIEPVAIEVSKKHADNNGVDIEFLVTSELPEGYSVDLIISNILKQPLIDFAPSFAKSLTQNGRVILSGFLAYQMEEVKTAYENAGLKVLGVIDKDGWITMTLGTGTVL